MLQYVKEGSLLKADSIAELAEKAGVRLEALLTTIEQYNADCDAKLDSGFFKDPSYLKPIRKPPFYAARIRRAVLVATGAGLRIDRRSRVLNEASQPIAGLYAAGEASGGVITERYIAGGISIANNMVFGRIAGREAAEFARADSNS